MYPKRVVVLVYPWAYIALAVSAFALASGGCRSDSGRKIEVAVINDGDKPIFNIHIDFVGGQIFTPIVSPNQRQSFQINPRAPSHLTLTFRDAADSEHVRKIDTYFEAGYKGRIEVRIDNAANVKWKDEISL
jgi:hypothetical protein